MNFLRKQKKEIGVIAFCFVISFLFLMYATKSSFLYPMNDWVDANAFFSMGKGMMQGKVLYADLFEQKGPLLYLIHGISYLISNRSFIGVFLFEVVSFTTFLYFAYRLMALFIQKKYTFLLLPIFAFFMLHSYNFSHGDSAEEFCFPFLMISLYYLVRYFKQKTVNYSFFLINGIVAGLVLTIKYTMLGFWFAWMMMLFFDLVIKKQYKKAVLSCLWFLGGMLLPMIPWLLYFLVTGTLKEFIDVYFLFNMTSYSKTLTIGGRVLKLVANTINNYGKNTVVLWMTTFGFAFVGVAKKETMSHYQKLSILVCYLFLIFGVYGGGVAFRYYFIILMPFMIFGFILLGKLLEALLPKLKRPVLLGSLTTIFFFVLFMNFGHNLYFLKEKKEDLVQYKFASIIEKEDNPTLLNYGFLDGGFYLTTGLVPNTRYFQLNNLDHQKYPMIIDAQRSYIKNREIEFVVVRFNKNNQAFLLNYAPLHQNYDLIATEKQKFQGKQFTYQLYQLKITPENYVS